MFTNITRARCDRCGDVVDMEYGEHECGDKMADLILKNPGWSSLETARRHSRYRIANDRHLALCPECSELFDEFMDMKE